MAETVWHFQAQTKVDYRANLKKTGLDLVEEEGRQKSSKEAPARFVTDLSTKNTPSFQTKRRAEAGKIAETVRSEEDGLRTEENLGTRLILFEPFAATEKSIRKYTLFDLSHISSFLVPILSPEIPQISFENYDHTTALS